MESKFNRCRGDVTISVQLISYLPDPGAKSPPPSLPCSWLLKAAVLVQLQTLSASGQTGVGQTGPAPWSHPSCQRTILPCHFPPQTHSQRFRLPDGPKEQWGWYNCVWSSNGKGAFTSASVGRTPFSCRLTWGVGRVSFLHSLRIKRDPKRTPTSGAKRRTMFPGSTKLNLWTHAHHRLDLCWVSPTKQKNLNCDFFFKVRNCCISLVFTYLIIPKW